MGVSDDLPISVVRPTWPGLHGLREFVVFGDSYSSSLTVDEDDPELEASRNWIDRVVSAIQSTASESCHIHNYARPGNTAEDDLTDQLTRFFCAYPKKSSPSAPPSLPPDATLYVIWLGINDCGRSDVDDLEETLETLFDAFHTLYVRAGARNILLVDVPPMDRSPAAEDVTINLEEGIAKWNSDLRARAATFAAESAQASVFLFSAHTVLADVLDDPSDFDIDDDSIWADGLHVTGEVHAVFAKRALEALCST